MRTSTCTSHMRRSACPSRWSVASPSPPIAPHHSYRPPAPPQRPCVVHGFPLPPIAPSALTGCEHARFHRHQAHFHRHQVQKQHGTPMTVPCGSMAWPGAIGPYAYEYMHQPHAQAYMSQPAFGAPIGHPMGGGLQPMPQGTRSGLHPHCATTAAPGPLHDSPPQRCLMVLSLLPPQQVSKRLSPLPTSPHSWRLVLSLCSLQAPFQ